MPRRTPRIATLCLAVLATLGATVTAADKPAASSSSDDLDTVVVAGKRVPIRKSIQTFVAGITRLEDDLVSRWRDPVCPHVVTTSESLRVYIRERLLDVADSVPVRHTRKADCAPNLFIAGTPLISYLGWLTVTLRPGRLDVLSDRGVTLDLHARELLDHDFTASCACSAGLGGRKQCTKAALEVLYLVRVVGNGPTTSEGGAALS